MDLIGGSVLFMTPAVFWDSSTVVAAKAALSDCGQPSTRQNRCFECRL